MISYLKYCILSTGLIYGSFVTVNILLDPLHFLGTSILPVKGAGNPRFDKIEYLKDHHQNFNTYIFGSSRAGALNPQEVNRLLPGAKTYNMTCNSCNQYENILHLRYFLKNGYPVKNILLMVEIYHINVWKVRQDDFTAKVHPEVTGESVLLFNLDYATSIAPPLISKVITNNINGTQRVFAKDGLIDFSRKEKLIAQGHEEYIERVFGHDKPPSRAPEDREQKPQPMQALAEIVELAKDNDINLFVFFAPNHHSYINSYSIDDYIAFLRKIVSITDFWDFGGLNSVTTDNHNYYEQSHFRYSVGDQVLEILLNDKASADADYPWFGQLVTGENIESVVKRKRDEYNNFIAERNYFSD